MLRRCTETCLQRRNFFLLLVTEKSRARFLYYLTENENGDRRRLALSYQTCEIARKKIPHRSQVSLAQDFTVL